jgi:hypothetical protein
MKKKALLLRSESWKPTASACGIRLFFADPTGA